MIKRHIIPFSADLTKSIGKKAAISHFCAEMMPAAALSAGFYGEGIRRPADAVGDNLSVRHGGKKRYNRRMGDNIKVISLTRGAFTNQYNGCGRGWVEFSDKTEKSRPLRMRYADTLDDKGSDWQDGYAECVDEDGCFTDGGGEKIPALQRPGARKVINGKLRMYGNFSCWQFSYYSPTLL